MNAQTYESFDTKFIKFLQYNILEIFALKTKDINKKPKTWTVCEWQML